MGSQTNSPHPLHCLIQKISKKMLQQTANQGQQWVGISIWSTTIIKPYNQQLRLKNEGCENLVQPENLHDKFICPTYSV